MNKNLPFPLKEKLVAFLRKNMDLFAWIAADMPEINPELISHHLATFPDVWLVTQKRKKMSLDIAQEVQKQVQALLDTGFYQGGNLSDLVI